MDRSPGRQRRASLGDSDFVARVGRDNARERDRFVAELARLGVTTPRSQTNFVFFVPRGSPRCDRISRDDTFCVHLRNVTEPVPMSPRYAGRLRART